MLTIITYTIYTVITLALAIWVGWTLHRHGRQFVIDAFHGDETRGDAVNHLLLVGFYLMNIGLVLLFLRVGATPTTVVEAIEYCATKLGVVLLLLGTMHYLNMYNLNKLRVKGGGPAAHATDAQAEAVG